MSKYSEDDQYENYMQNIASDTPTCKACIKKDKLIIKHWLKHDDLKREIAELIKFSNKLVSDNCKLKDQLKVLRDIII